MSVLPKDCPFSCGGKREWRFYRIYWFWYQLRNTLCNDQFRMQSGSSYYFPERRKNWCKKREGLRFWVWWNMVCNNRRIWIKKVLSIRETYRMGRVVSGEGGLGIWFRWFINRNNRSTPSLREHSDIQPLIFCSFFIIISPSELKASIHVFYV